MKTELFAARHNRDILSVETFTDLGSDTGSSDIDGLRRLNILSLAADGLPVVLCSRRRRRSSSSASWPRRPSRTGPSRSGSASEQITRSGAATCSSVTRPVGIWGQACMQALRCALLVPARKRRIKREGCQPLHLVGTTQRGGIGGGQSWVSEQSAWMPHWKLLGGPWRTCRESQQGHAWQ